MDTSDPHAIRAAIFEPQLRGDRKEVDNEVVKVFDRSWAREKKPSERALLVMEKDGIAEIVG